MKRVLPILVLAATAGLAAPAMAQTGTTSYRAVAAGALEAPPNPSPAMSLVTIELNGTQLLVDAPFRDLIGATAAAHIHCCTADAFTGVAPVALPFPDFPTGVHAGDYSSAISLGDEAAFNSAFLTANGGTAQGAYSALLEGINANEAYVNIHTDAYPNGEIRGFLVAAPPVPEPGQWAMLGMGLGGLWWMSRRRRVPAGRPA